MRIPSTWLTVVIVIYLRACFAIATTEAGRDVVREGEAPAEPSLHRQVSSVREYPARQEPRPPEKQHGSALTETGSSADSVPEPGPEQSIRIILRQQARDWNSGDLDGFMRAYWKSDQLTFSSGGTTTRGWEATLANYQRRYPTRKEMGTVRFDQLEILPLGREAALVLGRWTLAREEEPVGGNFSLVFRRIDGHWRIVHDHTSRLAPPAKKT